MVEYLFGLDEEDSEGINHYLLEAKIFIFYNWREKVRQADEEQEAEDTETTQAKLVRFHCRVRRVIKTEKQIATNIYGNEKRRESFYKKWEKFSDIYQIFGPDDIEI